MGIAIDDDAAQEIAKRSRGTPRIVNRLLKRVRDFAEVSGGKITIGVASKALDALEVDKVGLDKMDRLLLTTMVEKFNGGPVGIDTLALAISEEVDTITDIYEPFLIQSGFIARTPRGRIVTESGFNHIRAKLSNNFQKELL
jgi:Holliday junction DNA helicase RuvB